MNFKVKMLKNIISVLCATVIATSGVVTSVGAVDNEEINQILKNIDDCDNRIKDLEQNKVRINEQKENEIKKLDSEIKDSEQLLVYLLNLINSGEAQQDGVDNVKRGIEDKKKKKNQISDDRDREINDLNQKTKIEETKKAKLEKELDDLVKEKEEQDKFILAYENAAKELENYAKWLRQNEESLKDNDLRNRLLDLFKKAREIEIAAKFDAKAAHEVAVKLDVVLKDIEEFKKDFEEKKANEAREKEEELINAKQLKAMQELLKCKANQAKYELRKKDRRELLDAIKEAAKEKKEKEKLALERKNAAKELTNYVNWLKQNGLSLKDNNLHKQLNQSVIKAREIAIAAKFDAKAAREIVEKFGVVLKDIEEFKKDFEAKKKASVEKIQAVWRGHIVRGKVEEEARQRIGQISIALSELNREIDRQKELVDETSPCYERFKKLSEDVFNYNGVFVLCAEDVTKENEHRNKLNEFQEEYRRVMDDLDKEGKQEKEKFVLEKNNAFRVLGKYNVWLKNNKLNSASNTSFEQLRSLLAQANEIAKAAKFNAKAAREIAVKLDVVLKDIEEFKKDFEEKKANEAREKEELINAKQLKAMKKLLECKANRAKYELRKKDRRELLDAIKEAAKEKKEKEKFVLARKNAVKKLTNYVKWLKQNEVSLKDDNLYKQLAQSLIKAREIEIAAKFDAKAAHEVAVKLDVALKDIEEFKKDFEAKKKASVEKIQAVWKGRLFRNKLEKEKEKAAINITDKKFEELLAGDQHVGNERKVGDKKWTIHNTCGIHMLTTLKNIYDYVDGKKEGPVKGFNNVIDNYLANGGTTDRLFAKNAHGGLGVSLDSSDFKGFLGKNKIGMQRFGFYQEINIVEKAKELNKTTKECKKYYKEKLKNQIKSFLVSYMKGKNFAPIGTVGGRHWTLLAKYDEKTNKILRLDSAPEAAVWVDVDTIAANFIQVNKWGDGVHSFEFEMPIFTRTEGIKDVQLDFDNFKEQKQDELIKRIG